MYNMSEELTAWAKRHLNEERRVLEQHFYAFSARSRRIEMRRKLKKKNREHAIEVPTKNELGLSNSQEVLIALTLDRNGVSWIRPEKGFHYVDGKGSFRTYFPDFFLPDYNLYLEAKTSVKTTVKDKKAKEYSITSKGFRFGYLYFKDEIMKKLNTLFGVKYGG